MPLFIFWITFLLDLELNFIDKLLVFRWELIVLLLLQICIFFCYERDFMKSLSRENQADIIEVYDIRDDFDFDIVNFPFLDRDVTYGVYISQLIRFARASSNL